MRVYINNRDLLTWPRAMAEKLASQGHEVVFVDNLSTYEPLLDFYKNCPFRVVKLVKNYGHKAVWLALQDEIDLNGKPYVVTDPDLDISSIPDNWGEVLTEGLKRFPQVAKCGFSLDDTRVPSENPAFLLDGFHEYPEGGHPDQWGARIREKGSKCSFYRYPVDTTFALYRARARYSISGVRAGRPYTARHLPWHIVLREDPESKAFQIPLDDELHYYFTHAGDSSTTAKRLRKMLEAYDAGSFGSQPVS